MAKKSNKIDFIKSILSERFIDPVQDKLIENKGGEIINPFVMERQIVSHHDINQYVLYRFDPDGGDVFPFFNNTPGLKKICDYILFAEYGQNLFILLIEMKHGNKSPHKQLESSMCFINYILATAERIDYKIDNFHIRKIRICEQKSKKRQTKSRDLVYNESLYLDYNTVRDFRIKELLI